MSAISDDADVSCRSVKRTLFALSVTLLLTSSRHSLVTSDDTTSHVYLGGLQNLATPLDLHRELTAPRNIPDSVTHPGCP